MDRRGLDHVDRPPAFEAATVFLAQSVQGSCRFGGGFTSIDV
jgi:hypothetical protein